MATASAATFSTVDNDKLGKGDGPTFGMQKGMRIQQGQILYQGKYIDQSQFYRVSAIWILSSLATYPKNPRVAIHPSTFSHRFVYRLIVEEEC